MSVRPNKVLQEVVPRSPGCATQRVPLATIKIVGSTTESYLTLIGVTNRMRTWTTSRVYSKERLVPTTPKKKQYPIVVLLGKALGPNVVLLGTLSLPVGFR